MSYKQRKRILMEHLLHLTCCIVEVMMAPIRGVHQRVRMYHAYERALKAAMAITQ